MLKCHIQSNICWCTRPPTIGNTFRERPQTLGGHSFEIKGALPLNSVVSFPLISLSLFYPPLPSRSAHDLLAQFSVFLVQSFPLRQSSDPRALGAVHTGRSTAYWQALRLEAGFCTLA